jgi:hypothetical protein
MASLASVASGEVEPPKRPLEWSQFEGAHVRSYRGGSNVWVRASSADMFAQAPEKRHGQTMVAYGNKFYIFGGLASIACTNDLWTLEVGASIREILLSHIGPWRFVFARTCWYKLGSHSLFFCDSAGAHCLWTRLEFPEGSPMPPRRTGHTATVVGNKMYIFGYARLSCCTSSWEI